MSGDSAKGSERVEIKFDAEAYCAEAYSASDILNKVRVQPLTFQSILDKVDFASSLNDELMKQVVVKIDYPVSTIKSDDILFRSLEPSNIFSGSTGLLALPVLLGDLRIKANNLNIAGIAFRVISDPTEPRSSDKDALESAGVWDTVQNVIDIRDKMTSPEELASYERVIAEHYRDFAGACAAPASATPFGSGAGAGSAPEESSSATRF